MPPPPRIAIMVNSVKVGDNGYLLRVGGEQADRAANKTSRTRLKRNAALRSGHLTQDRSGSIASSRVRRLSERSRHGIKGLRHKVPRSAVSKRSNTGLPVGWRAFLLAEPATSGLRVVRAGTL